VLYARDGVIGDAFDANEPTLVLAKFFRRYVSPVHARGRRTLDGDQSL
jgi:hypothetical protein